MNNSQRIVDKLFSEYPAFHGENGGHNWTIGREVLEWIAANVNPNENTLETGCGYSTIVFAASGANHTTISPISQEHLKLKTWGEANNVSFEKICFHADRSENVLPYIQISPIKLALIDGWHAFPGPILDWFFVCNKIENSGYVIVDDTQIRACALLRDFLESEKGRWRKVGCYGQSEVFQKMTDHLFVGDWLSQPFNLQLQKADSKLVKVAKKIPFLKELYNCLRGR